MPGAASASGGILYVFGGSHKGATVFYNDLHAYLPVSLCGSDTSSSLVPASTAEQAPEFTTAESEPQSTTPAPSPPTVIAVVRLQGSLSSFLHQDWQRSAFKDAVLAIASGLAVEITFLRIADSTSIPSTTVTALRVVTAGQFDVEFSAQLPNADAAQRFLVRLQDESTLRDSLSEHGLSLVALVRASLDGVLTTPTMTPATLTTPSQPGDVEDTSEQQGGQTLLIVLSVSCGALAMGIAICCYIFARGSRGPPPSDDRADARQGQGSDEQPVPSLAARVAQPQPRQDRLVPLLEDAGQGHLEAGRIDAQPSTGYPSLGAVQDFIIVSLETDGLS
eukprot:1395017-Rhodomonas_salina.1